MSDAHIFNRTDFQLSWRAALFFFFFFFSFLMFSFVQSLL